MSISWTRAIQGPELLHQSLCKGKWNPKFSTHSYSVPFPRDANAWAKGADSSGAPSTGNLRKGRDTTNAGGYAEAAIFPARFYADDRGLAANPALFAVGELIRQHQDHLQFATNENFGVCVQEYSTSAQIARMPGRRYAWRRADRYTHAHRRAWRRTAVRLGVGHERPKIITYRLTGEIGQP
jgi:hypothetical protein